jgi:hypothetical protein
MRPVLLDDEHVAIRGQPVGKTAKRLHRVSGYHRRVQSLARQQISGLQYFRSNGAAGEQ